MTSGGTLPDHIDRSAPPVTIGWRGIAVLTSGLLVALTMYGVGVLLPYYVNDLDRLPLAEVTNGAHDPKDLWPGNALGGLPQVAGFFSLAVLPIAAFAGLAIGGLSLWKLWRHRDPQRVPKSLALLPVMGASVAALSFMSSATGAALSVWRLD